MERPPRPKGNLLNKTRWARMVFQSILISIATFAVFYKALEVGKDIDAITGATISSRAVIEGAKGALQVTKKVGGK